MFLTIKHTEYLHIETPNQDPATLSFAALLILTKMLLFVYYGNTYLFKTYIQRENHNSRWWQCLDHMISTINAKV